MPWLSLVASLAFAAPVPDPGGALPWFLQPDDDGRFAATLRADDLSDGQRATLRGLGVSLRQVGDRPAHVGDVWAIDGSLEALHAAQRAGFVVEVSPRLDLFPPPTLDTGAQVQAFDLWAAGPTPADGATGGGTKILDIDSGIDIFHPHFFRADAGHHAWIDVDDDGRLDPGRDGIDLDGDGAIGSDEVLQLAQAWAWQFDWDAYAWDYLYDSGVLDPRRDWLYIDRNEDGQRNRGAVEGFDESDPGYGEPLFVPDDADRSSVIEPNEKLVQLGTSVVAAVRTDKHTYVRGVDLIDYAPTQDISSHGTGVGGILTGGQLPRQRATVGLAPDAELYIATTRATDAELAETLTWAEDEDIDVVLHEYAPWTGYALDGTSAVETMVDAQQADGMVHVCPAGNLADAGKHAVSAVEDGQLAYTFTVPTTTIQPGWPWQYLWFELHGEAGAADIDQCAFTAPDGTVYDEPLRAFGVELDDGLTLWGSSVRSGADRPWTTMSMFDEAELQVGTWAVTCATQAADGTEVHLFLNDYYSGWGRGITVGDEVREGTMGIPSTSDTCLSIGAYAGRHADQDVGIGELRWWSSLGPTVDGRRGIDLISPDDPFSPTPSYALPDWEAPYAPFGGTSGASPHVAALAALMVQLQPELTGLDVRDMLMDGAEPVSGDPDHVGAGKVRGYHGWAGEAPAMAPTPQEVSVEVHTDGTTDDCTATLALAEGQVARVDVDYDGTVDHDWSETPDLSALVEAGPTTLRVEVAEAGWVVGGAVATVDVPACPPPEPEPEPTVAEDTTTEGTDGSDADGVADTEEEAKGCGCAAAPGGGGGLVAAWLVGLIVRRRRGRARR